MMNSKFNINEFLLLFLSLALLTLMLFGMSGCDVTKKQTKHYKKFIQYGGKVNCKGDTLWKYDTSYVEGVAKIDSFPIPCNCPEPVIGYTNKQVRMLLKHQKDSMNYLIKLEKIRSQKLQDSLNGVLKLEKQETKQGKEVTKQVKEETKQVQSDNKSENIDALANLLWVFFAVAVVIAIIIYLIKRK